MWHYNFDYLSHGMNGYKYIDKYRDKNGKWNYVYEAQRARERGIKRSTIATREYIKNQLRGTPSYWDYLTTGKVPENKSSNTAKPISTRKSEIRQKVDPAAEVQRERERAIKEGMSSNRQWDRDRVSKGSSVEAAQKAREREIAKGKAAAKQYSISVGAKKNAELAKIIGDMINGAKSDIKKNVRANFKTNEAQRGRAEDINKSVEAAREAQRKKENSLGARIKRNIDDDIATAKALDNSKAKSPKEIIKSNAKDIIEGKVNSMSKEEQKWANAAKQQEREHSRTTAAIDAQNARQRAIEASQARQRQAAAAKQQEEERKKAGNRSVERAQNAREAAIAKSVQTTKETNQAKQVANASKQQEAERRMSGSTKRENALRDDKYISELLNKELGLPSSSISMNDKSVKEMRNAYAKVYQKIKNDSKIAPSTKDEFKKILDSLSGYKTNVENSQDIRQKEISKSHTNTVRDNWVKSHQSDAAKQQELERKISGSTKRENVLRDSEYINELLNRELGLPSSDGHNKSLEATRNAYEKVYQILLRDKTISKDSKDEFKKILDYLNEEYTKKWAKKK